MTKGHSKLSRPSELVFEFRNQENSLAREEEVRREDSDQVVDLEIILLGPNDTSSDYKSETRRRKERSSKKPKSRNENESVSQEDKKSPEDQKLNQPKVEEDLLKQMERRYRENLMPDDNTYVDYLDYF